MENIYRKTVFSIDTTLFANDNEIMNLKTNSRLSIRGKYNWMDFPKIVWLKFQDNSLDITQNFRKLQEHVVKYLEMYLQKKHVL